jgi:hypothetical protein
MIEDESKISTFLCSCESRAGRNLREANTVLASPPTYRFSLGLSEHPHTSYLSVAAYGSDRRLELSEGEAPAKYTIE